MVKFLKRALLVIVGVYLVLCVALYFEQSKFIFVPQREVQFTPKDFGCEFSDVAISEHGYTLRGWWLAADPRASSQMGSRTLIYFHGNGGSIGANAQHACRLRNIGLNVLIFDYRGYGQSSDMAPTEDTVFADAESAWDYLTRLDGRGRGVSANKVIIYGHSLGGAVAIETAKKHPDA